MSLKWVLRNTTNLYRAPLNPHSNMNTSWLIIWRAMSGLAIAWVLLWFLVWQPSTLFNPLAILSWVIFPWLYIFYATRKGHYKPLFLALIVTLLFSIISMSYLSSQDWYYALPSFILWFSAFYCGYKHLKTIKQTLINTTQKND